MAALLWRHVGEPRGGEVAKLPQTAHSFALCQVLPLPCLQLRLVPPQGLQLALDGPRCVGHGCGGQTGLGVLHDRLGQTALQPRDLGGDARQLIALHAHLLAAQAEVVAGHAQESFGIAQQGDDLGPHRVLQLVGVHAATVAPFGRFPCRADALVLAVAAHPPEGAEVVGAAAAAYRAAGEHVELVVHVRARRPVERGA
ncbi:MAG: hypothetical protein M3422_25320 [Actinomycetota bacterium]|nr:hypothetical protein [Actinomycetota bacterium]